MLYKFVRILFTIRTIFIITIWIIKVLIYVFLYFDVFFIIVTIYNLVEIKSIVLLL